MSARLLKRRGQKKEIRSNVDKLVGEVSLLCKNLSLDPVSFARPAPCAK
jgi:hypothetical protein